MLKRKAVIIDAGDGATALSERLNYELVSDPHLAERLNSLVTQSDGIALSSPGKLDDRFGYHCHCGIIAINQTQLADCIFKRRCEHRDSVWPKDFLLSLGGVRKRHLTIRA
jgi:hypothetical protein